ncbi:MAG TPA: hypothetical protein VM534_06235 [Thermoanaerobaculia bacterium]|nr:hypothetical protein [Thermoanaerobaculia bacterium]
MSELIEDRSIRPQPFLAGDQANATPDDLGPGNPSGPCDPVQNLSRLVVEPHTHRHENLLM